MPKLLQDSTVSKLSAASYMTMEDKYIDFLCGCTLQEIVFPSSTLTHRKI
jgi:hypothetical protein